MKELIKEHIEEIRKILYEITDSKSFLSMNEDDIIESALAYYIISLKREHYER